MLAAVIVSASATKLMAETALKLMWIRSDAKRITAETHLRCFHCGLNVHVINASLVLVFY